MNYMIPENMAKGNKKQADNSLFYLLL